MSLRESIGTIIMRSPLLGPAEKVHGWLLKWHAKKAGTFVQHGERLFVLSCLKNRAGTNVDVGANHPLKISNTYLLWLKG